MRAGDVLASSPLHVRMPLSIWPKVSIHRPHTDTWHLFMTELGDLEDRVRRIAVPKLVVGAYDVDPLPPQFETRVGHDDTRAILAVAGTVPARERSMKRILASTSRVDLVEIVGLHHSRPDGRQLRVWAEKLDDDGVLAWHDRLIAARFDHRALEVVLRQLTAEVAASTPRRSCSRLPARRGEVAADRHRILRDHPGADAWQTPLLASPRGAPSTSTP